MQLRFSYNYTCMCSWIRSICGMMLVPRMKSEPPCSDASHVEPVTVTSGSSSALVDTLNPVRAREHARVHRLAGPQSEAKEKNIRYRVSASTFVARDAHVLQFCRPGN
jgi:hypothetical protein